MYLRKINKTKNGKRHDYWALVESVRTERGPRQRIVSYLGDLDEPDRLEVKLAAEGRKEFQKDLFDSVEPEWVHVDTRGVRVANVKDFGGPWLAQKLITLLHLDRFFEKHLPKGREEIPWSAMVQVLICSRLSEPSSELHIAEHSFEHSALSDILGIPAGKVNEDRLYRALDKLLPVKGELEKHLKERAGSLFDLEYDLFLYDVTSTYFEGEAKANPLAQYGYSRDKRGDCKQVCIGLVVTRDGFPLGYEVFGGGTSDVTTVEEIVETMERRYGKTNRIWVMDRGMASEDNFEFLQEEGRRYILGTQRGQLKKYEAELLRDDWKEVHSGLEVKMVKCPGGQETYILCRSADRAKKEKAIHERFEKKIEEALVKMSEGCEKRKYKTGVLERRIGRLLQRYSRAAGLFDVHVNADETGRNKVTWRKREEWRAWSDLSEGCYMLRSNIEDWSPEDLWKAYIQLTEAEEAFRIHKSDLKVRPIWHQKEERVLAHIFVCFLAYVLWKTLSGLIKQTGLGDEPRKVFHEIAKIKLVDVILPTRQGYNITLRCVAEPTTHQAILLQRLKFILPKRFLKTKCSEDF